MYIPYRIAELVIIFIAIPAVMIYAAAAQAAEDTSFQPTSEELEIVKLTNQQREQHGLQALALDPMLTASARKHSENMARAKVMAHTLNGSTMTSRIRESGYKFLAIGENIGFNEPTPEAVVDAWMHSPGHRANILNKNFTGIGAGVARDDEGQPYYTQDFGRPVSAGPTESATFSMVNDTGLPATIVLPGSSNSTRLDPGSSGSFTVSGVGNFPPIGVNIGDETRKLKFEDGVVYRISRTGDGLKIESEK